MRNMKAQIGDIWEYNTADYTGSKQHIVINHIGRTKYRAVSLTDPSDYRVITKQNLNQYWRKVS